MSKFNRNDSSLIQKEIRDSVQHPKIGEVSAVYEHGAENDDSNFEADVIVDGSLRDKCPILNPGNDAIDIPETGDKVLLVYTDEQNKKPFVTDTVWTTQDRPPIGKAGMYRRRFRLSDSDNPSPAGPGDVHFTGYTQYDKDPNNNDKDEITPEKSVMQIAKHASDKNFKPTDQEEVPVKIEFYDAPIDDEAHVTMSLNYVDGNSSAAKWGVKFNLKTGEVKLVDPSGYGIVSDGDGNFTWEYESLTENQVSGGGSLSL